MTFPFPVLLSDVGGTNARFAVLRDKHAQPEILGSVGTSAFPTFDAAAQAILGLNTLTPVSCILCAAGPVAGARVELTNANWTIDGHETARRLGLAHGLMLNDFEAQALSLPALRPEWLKEIGHGQAQPGGARVVHGPGTGLGTAALIDVEGRWRAVASEGSHSDFAPVYPDEMALWPHIEKRQGRITPETLISGPGLRRLHRARLASLGHARPDEGEADIIAAALAIQKSAEADSVRLFWRLAARFAGDVALTFLATGGVYLAGGVLPRMMDLLDVDEFRRVFENKAPYERLARKIPVHVLLQTDAVLHGMAEIARAPERFAIDYAARDWRSMD